MSDTEKESPIKASAEDAAAAEEKEEEQPQDNSKKESAKEDEEDEEEALIKGGRRRQTNFAEFLNNLDLSEPVINDPKIAEDMEFIKNTKPESRLEICLTEALYRKDAHIHRLMNEIGKLKQYISKRKQSYKRKRKDDGAPRRALSAYNIFMQDRFAQLAKENQAALTNGDPDAQLQRVASANLVTTSGHAWKELPAEEKAKYEERAKADRKRYDDQMAKYQPPERATNRKRNKTGYNMFFSAHVLRLKQSEMGVPSERGSVARLVGNAWKALSTEEKQYYEREADKHNGNNPVEKDVDDDDDDDKRGPGHGEHYHMHDAPPYGAMPGHVAYYPPQYGAYGPPGAYYEYQPAHHGRSTGAYNYGPPPPGYGASTSGR